MHFPLLLSNRIVLSGRPPWASISDDPAPVSLDAPMRAPGDHNNAHLAPDFATEDVPSSASSPSPPDEIFRRVALFG